MFHPLFLPKQNLHRIPIDPYIKLKSLLIPLGNPKLRLTRAGGRHSLLPMYSEKQQKS